MFLVLKGPVLGKEGRVGDVGANDIESYRKTEKRQGMETHVPSLIEIPQYFK